MFANGPVWTIAGAPSRVWIRFGLIASLRSTAIEPAAPTSSAVTGLPSWSRATVMWPSRARRSARSRAAAQDRHRLGGRRDVEAGAADAAAGRPQAGVDAPERPVVHVEAAPPGDRGRVDAELVAVEDVGVDQRGEQVRGGGDRVDVAGEVEIQVLHRRDLRPAGARAATLDPEDGAHRRLAEADHARHGRCGRGRRRGRSPSSSSPRPAESA